MKIALAELESVSPYSQSRFHATDKLEKELSDDYERRTWREKCHYDKRRNNELYIPPMAFANSLKEAAKYLSIQVPGKGKATFTKNFEAGVLVMEPLYLGIDRDAVDCDWIHANADGVPGSGKRVMRCFPRIDHWQGTVQYHVLDDLITRDVFEQVLVTSGQLIGIGRFRPRNRGFYGRFRVNALEFG